MCKVCSVLRVSTISSIKSIKKYFCVACHGNITPWHSQPFQMLAAVWIVMLEMLSTSFWANTANIFCVVHVMTFYRCTILLFWAALGRILFAFIVIKTCGPSYNIKWYPCRWPRSLNVGNIKYRSDP
jgi:hypothetical protein